MIKTNIKSQVDFNQIIPPELQRTFYSPIGLAFIFCIFALIFVRMFDGRDRQLKLARARWAGVKEKKTARKLACRQIQERKHNRVALFIGTPKNTQIEILTNKKIVYLPEDASRLYLPDAQRGILVCGGAGSGKTFSMINPLIRSAIDQGLPIILYDFKYSHQESATASAKGHFGGCATKSFFNPQDDVAAERFSNFLGNEEIKYKQRSRSTGGKGGASISNSDQSSTRSLFEINQFNSLPEGKAVIVSPGFRSKKDMGVPLLEQINIPQHDINAEKMNVSTWYKAQQNLVKKSTLRDITEEEMELRILEAERLLPFVDSTVLALEKLKSL